MKRPAFQFYPADWLRDTALRTCSCEARGLWMDMICYMHEGNPYGHLKVNQKVILPANLASMAGVNLEQILRLLDELEEAGVFSRDEEGCIFSRRMIKDEKLRELRASGGKLGGNPALVNPKVNPKVNLPPNLPPGGKVKQKPPPSSSLSSSSSASPIEEDGHEDSVLDPAAPKAKKFSPPTMEDVLEYSASLAPPFSQPEKWMAHYQSNGWKVGKNPMKDWKAAIRTWHAGEKPTQPAHRQTGYREQLELP